MMAPMAGLPMAPTVSMAVFSGQRAACYAAGVVRMAPHLCAARYAAIMVCVSVVRTVGIAVLSVVHMHSCLRTACHTAYAMAVLSSLRTAVYSAKVMMVDCRLYAS